MSFAFHSQRGKLVDHLSKEGATTAHGKFHWNELMTRDVAKAKNFYAESLGWTYDDVPMGEVYGTYTIIKSGDEMAGGMFKMDGPMFEGRPESWFTYVAVDDLDDRLRKAREAGGTVMARALGRARHRTDCHRRRHRRRGAGVVGPVGRRDVTASASNVGHDQGRRTRGSVRLMRPRVDWPG